jgi:hypothetical protein
VVTISNSRGAVVARETLRGSCSTPLAARASTAVVAPATESIGDKS